MNKRLLAKLLRNNALKNILTAPANAAALAALKPVAIEVPLCLASFADAETKALAAGITYEGYTVNRDNAKATLGHEAAIICGNAYVRFIKLNKNELAAQLHINESDYTLASIELAAQMAQAGHDVMFYNLADLTDYVSAADITKLQGYINALNIAEGITLSLHQSSPADTAAAEEAIRKSDEEINCLLIVIRPLEKTNASLYNSIVLNSYLPPINVHHTYLTVTVLDATTKAPKAGAVLTVNTSTTKTATTDASGIGTLEQVKAGKTILKVVAPGKPAIDVHIQVSRGKTNAVSVEV